MTSPNIKVELQHYLLKIWIDDVLHVAIPRGAIAIQSWRDGPTHFSIEYYYGGGQRILTEYDSCDKWKSILSGLDRELHL